MAIILGMTLIILYIQCVIIHLISFLAHSRSNTEPLEPIRRRPDGTAAENANCTAVPYSRTVRVHRTLYIYD
jgi:hypothetical protein